MNTSILKKEIIYIPIHIKGFYFLRVIRLPALVQILLVLFEVKSGVMPNRVQYHS